MTEQSPLSSIRTSSSVVSVNSPQVSLLQHSAEMNYFYVVIEIIIALLSISGNVLVCWAVAINTTLKNATNYFLVSLAVADILVGCLAIPFAITISLGIQLDFYGCLFLACFVLVLTQSSIFSLLAIAIDRYLAVKIHLRWAVIRVCLCLLLNLSPLEQATYLLFKTSETSALCKCASVHEMQGWSRLSTGALCCLCNYIKPFAAAHIDNLKWHPDNAF